MWHICPLFKGRYDTNIANHIESCRELAAAGSEENAMFFDDNAQEPTTYNHHIGEDVTLLSAAEIDNRIAMLKAEIRRLETDRNDRNLSRAAAEALFRL